MSANKKVSAMAATKTYRILNEMWLEQAREQPTAPIDDPRSLHESLLRTAEILINEILPGLMHEIFHTPTDEEEDADGERMEAGEPPRPFTEILPFYSLEALGGDDWLDRFDGRYNSDIKKIIR